MGVLDLVGKVITEYKADTSDHKAKIKELSGEQKKAAQEQLKNIEDQNKAIDGHIKALGKVTLALGTVTAAVAIGRAGFEEYSKTVALRAGAAKVDIDRLSAAAGGLKSQMELLTLAQAGARGAFQLNTKEMETVAQGMRALTKEGFDSQKVFEVITETLKKGTLDELKQFGIVLKSSGDIAGDKNQILAALAGEIKNVGGNFNQAGDDVKRAGVKWEDTLHGVKESIGELVVQLEPFVDALANAVMLIGKAVELVGHIPGLGGGTADKSDINTITKNEKPPWWKVALTPGVVALQGAAAAFQSVPDTASPLLYEPSRPSVSEQWDLAQKRRAATGLDAVPWLERQALIERDQPRDPWTGKPLTTGFAVPRAPSAWRQALLAKLAAGPRPPGPDNRPDDAYQLKFAQVIASTDTASLLEAAGRAANAGRDDADWAGAIAKNDQRLTRFAATATDVLPIDMSGERSSTRRAAQSRLEEIFGPLDQFDAYRTAWAGLESTVSSAFDAWMTGSKGLGEAIKEAVAGFAKNLAIEALLQALRHGAYAIGELALGDVPGAAAHGLAAAKWGAVAVAAGLAAKGLAPSAGGSGASAGAGGSAGGYHGSTSSGPAVQVTAVIDGGYEESGRERSRRVGRLIQRAEQEGYSARPPAVRYE